MNSITKRLLAGVAAAATLLSGMALAGSAMAEGEGNFTENDLLAPQILTVTDSTNKDLTGKNLLPIRLAKYTAGQYDASGKITGYDIETMDTPSGLKSAIVAAAKAVAGAERQNEVSDSNPMLWVVQNLSTISPTDKTGNSTESPYSGTLRDFLTALAKSTVVKNATGTYMTVSNGESAGSSAIATVDSGIYAIVDKTTTTADAQKGAKNIVASIPMMTGTAIGENGKYNTLSNDTKLGTIEYKATLPTITKEITDSSSTQGTGSVSPNGEKKDKSDLAIGDDVTYTLTTKVPNYTGYDQYYLAMNDTLGAGLTLKSDSFTVKVDNSDLTKDTDYKVVVDSQNRQKFTILFAPTTDNSVTSNLLQTGEMKAKFPVDKTITVTYKATLNQNAVIGNTSDGAGNPNTVNLEYSNNPGTEDHGKTDDIKVKSYTGALTIQKRDPNGQPDAKLEGSIFTIKKKDENTSNLRFLAGTDGTYTLVPANYVAVAGEKVDDKLIVPASGNITVKGLDGEYTITEESSAYGATVGLPSFDAKVTVNQENGNVTVTNGADANKLVTANETAAQGGAIVVKNVHNFTEMPKTGATWLCIYAAMAVLCGGGAFLLLRSSKKRA